MQQDAHGKPAARVLLLGGAGVASNTDAPVFDETAQAFAAKHDLVACALTGSARSEQLAHTAARLYAGGVGLLALAGLNGAQRDAAPILEQLNGIPSVGAGETDALRERAYRCTINGVRLGVLSVGERRRGDRTAGGFADALDLRVLDRVRMLLSSCDHVLVYLCAGLGGAPLPLPEWRNLSRALLRAGATIVAGVSPDGAYGFERQQDGTACYSLGHIHEDESLLASAVLYRNGRYDLEVIAASNADGTLALGASDAFKARINAQNELFLNERAYHRQIDAFCREYVRQHAPALLTALTDAPKRTLLGALGKGKCAPRPMQEEAAYALFSDESLLYALVRGLSGMRNREEDAPTAPDR